MEKNKLTLADVAELAQVSKMSVSRALNGQAGVSEETRQRILDAARQLGYVQLANGTPGVTRSRPRLVGLLLPALNNSYMGEIVTGVCNAAESLDYGLMLYAQGINGSFRDIDSYLTFLDDNMLDGTLMVVPRDYGIIIEKLKQRNLPFVIVDHHSNTDDEPSVSATNRRGILDAMRHLLALGHTRIAFITGRMDITCSHDRLQGYQDGLAEVGLPFDPDLLREGDYLQPSGFHQTQALLKLDNPPTAIIASNDVMAFGAMDAAKAAEFIVGQDISIIGFDDIYMASQVYPALTTVRQPMRDMGKTAMEMLVSLIDGRTLLSVQRELATELIIRSSTGRNPHP